MPVVTSLEARYRGVLDRVALAAQRSGRRPEDVVTIAVTKHAEVDDIVELIRLGHEDFGENRVQQMLDRIEEVREAITNPSARFAQPAIRPGTIGAITIDGPGLDFSTSNIRWHMIGHLQRNKVKKVLPYVRLVHSVDSFRLVEEIHAWAHKKDQDVDILVQVNCSGEEQKFGCAPPAVVHLCEQIDSYVHLRLRGLMTIAEASDNPEDARPAFQTCAELFDDVKKLGYGEDQFNILSMGMSNDFEVAIECGANMVRVGSAIFGERAGAMPGGDEDE